MWLVPLAVIIANGLNYQGSQGSARTEHRIVAIGDCEPAAGAMNAATSGEPTMAGIISLARKLTQIWLAATVPNQVQFRLSTLQS